MKPNNPTVKMLRYYYAPLNSRWNDTSGESSRWNSKLEKPCKSKVSSFWSTFIYMLIERWPQLGHTSSYQPFLIAISLIIPIWFREYINKSRETKWPSVKDFMHWWHGKTEDTNFIASYFISFHFMYNVSLCPLPCKQCWVFNMLKAHIPTIFKVYVVSTVQYLMQV